MRETEKTLFRYFLKEVHGKEGEAVKVTRRHGCDGGFHATEVTIEYYDGEPDPEYPGYPTFAEILIREEGRCDGSCRATLEQDGFDHCFSW
jgi:hypothetical protein